MGRVWLVARLAGRDLRRRPGSAALLVLAITAATATLTLGLVLNGVTNRPYRQTRAATKGPDVVAQLGGMTVGPHGPRPADPAQVTAQVKTLTHEPGVAGYSGPYPVASAVVRARGRTAGIEAEGRAQALASVDQPKVVAGTWVRSGGVVLERTFAEALGVGVGDRLTLDGRPFRVAGVAVTAAGLPYPNLCYHVGGGCVFDLAGPVTGAEIGFAWVTEPDARSLASAQAPLSYFLNLKLNHPAAAPAGLATGWLAAPLVSSPGAALVGTPGAPAVTLSVVGLVVAVALMMALASTLVPAIRASRTDAAGGPATVSDGTGARWPRRRAGRLALSARLPVALLLGLRLAARRPRRALLSAASVAVTATGIVATAAFHAAVRLKSAGLSSGLGNPVVGRDEQMLLILTVVLVALTVLFAMCAAWAAVLDVRQAPALPRPLGASPRQVSSGIVAAQVLAAVPGALLGIPLGIGLFAVAARGAGVVVPPASWLAAAVLGTLAAIAVLAAIPARVGARRSVIVLLRSQKA